MPRDYQEGRLRFSFPEGWGVFRPETSAYYTRRFQNFCGGCKETDFVAWDVSFRTLWLLEVKDYTTSARTKPQDLFDELAQKARDTLALLAGAGANANPDRIGTKEFSTSCLPAASIRVVLHLELPAKSSKLHPAIKFSADATQSLRMKLRCIDPHALVVSTKCPPRVPWQARWSA
jgi:hypothetical protein